MSTGLGLVLCLVPAHASMPESGDVAFPPPPIPPPLLMGLPPELTAPPAPSPPVPSPPAPAPPPYSVGGRLATSFGAEQAASAKSTRAAGFIAFKEDARDLIGPPIPSCSVDG